MKYIKLFVPFVLLKKIYSDAYSKYALKAALSDEEKDRLQDLKDDSCQNNLLSFYINHSLYVLKNGTTYEKTILIRYLDIKLALHD